MSDEGGHYFETYGPFRLEPQGRKLDRHPAAWWRDHVETCMPGLSSAVGCYMFTMGDKHIKPWYVGKTVNQRGFAEEVFTQHKLEHYNWVLDEGYRGPPGLFLFPKITKAYNEEWRFSSGASHSSSIEWLEKTLMGMAYSQNQKLANSRDVTFFRTVHVRGVLGINPRGPRRGDVAKARHALLGDKPEDND